MLDIPVMLPLPVIHEPEVVLPALQPAGLTQTSHVAADPLLPVRSYTGPELNAPLQRFDAGQTGALSSALQGTIALLLMLLKFSRESREQAVMLRDVENQSMITAQKAQVEEMRKGVGLMIAMAVVAGVMAAGSAAIGGWGAYKNGKVVGLQKCAENGGAPCPMFKANEFAQRASNIQGLNSLNQSLGQMSNTSVQGADKAVQAVAKEYEVSSTMAQHEKQKVDDRLAFSSTFMKDVVQMLQQLAQSNNQAWRAAAGVV